MTSESNTSSPPKPFGHYPQLDAMRSVACLLVLVSHLVGERAFNALPADWFGVRALFQFAFVNGAAGVRIFFVLSGFLITSLVLHEKARSGTVSLGRFYMRRVLRIWPLYFLTLFFGFVLVPLAGRFMKTGSMTPNEAFVPFALFLGNFDIVRVKAFGGTSLVLGPTWSIAIEEQFYIVWPLLLAWVRPRFLGVVLAGVAVASGFGFVLFRDSETRTYFETLPNVLPLAAGALAAWVAFSFNDQLVRVLGRLNRTGISVALLALAAVACWAFAQPQVGWAAFACVAATSLLTALTIVDQLYAPKSALPLAHSRTLVWLGKYTYSLYLVHSVVLLVGTAVSKRVFADDTTVRALAVGFVECLVSVGVSIVVYRFVELKFLQLKHRFSAP